MPGVLRVRGVVGAGTMGAGIAQLACLAGARTLLFDPVEPALDRALDRIPADLERGAVRGRWPAADAQAAAGRLERADSLAGMGDCDLVIEAAPGQPPVKHELLGA